MSIRTLFGNCACVALLIVTLAPTTASATTLFDLIPGGSITVGTLTFSNFTYLGTGDMPGSAGVTVSSYVDPITDDVGLKFAGSFFDSPTSGGSDALIDFQVTENDVTKLVTGRHVGRRSVRHPRSRRRPPALPASPRLFSRPIPA